MPSFKSVAVIGAGAWGTALAGVAARAGRDTVLYARQPGRAAEKNVRAIAGGIVVGRQFGASAQAALTTRGFSELARLGRACGARGETMAGLSGLGDLILTCSRMQPPHFSLGPALP